MKTAGYGSSQIFKLQEENTQASFAPQSSICFLSPDLASDSPVLNFFLLFLRAFKSWLYALKTRHKTDNTYQPVYDVSCVLRCVYIVNAELTVVCVWEKHLSICAHTGPGSLHLCRRTWEAGAGGKFETCQGYIVSSRVVWATAFDPISKYIKICLHHFQGYSTRSWTPQAACCVHNLFTFQGQVEFPHTGVRLRLFTVQGGNSLCGFCVFLMAAEKGLGPLLGAPRTCPP